MATESPIVLFDGVCNLCNGAVLFILQRDRAAHFRFAALQSDAARRALGENPPLESIVLIEDGRAYTKSTAALQIARRLQFPWPLLYAFVVVPRPLRDWIYAWIARNRYRWFGKRESCMLPTPELQSRFLR